MLPQGIFLCPPTDSSERTGEIAQQFSEMHSGWANDMAEFGPWEESGIHVTDRELLRSDRRSSATLVATPMTDSTMEEVRALHDQLVLPEWGACIGAVQTGGRGQLRRPWVSTPGNLHISFVLPKLPEEGEWSEGLEHLLPLVCGYVLCLVLEELGADLLIKWPNDLIQSNRKVGGMLIEHKKETIVLGVGINLCDSPSDDKMREDSSVSAGVLRLSKHVGGPLALGEELVKRSKGVYASLLDDYTPNQFLSVLTGKMAWMGRTVGVRESGEEPVRAQIIGISRQGGLILLRGGKESTLLSGSIFPL